MLKLRRPPSNGNRSALQTKCLLALAILVLPWLQVVDAQQQQQQPPPPQEQHEPIVPVPRVQRQQAASQHESPHGEPPRENWVSTIGADAVAETLPLRSTAHLSPNFVPKKPKSKQHKHDYDPAVDPDDVRALATLAPAQSVRAPSPRRHPPAPAAVGGSGLSSPHNARSLGNWEVEDYVLLATVDGDLYASDRMTGKERWHSKFPDPMVETKHFRLNQTPVDTDFNDIDKYIWAVQPIGDGDLYVWMGNARAAGWYKMPFSMKSLVEELTPYATDLPPAVYTGHKKSIMMTLDASTGRVLKQFGAGGHVNTAESCIRNDALTDKDPEECSTTGTITIGKIEYRVDIQRRDGQPIAELRYSEWVPNNFDNDLIRNYNQTLDGKYIASRHDGKVYGFDDARSERRSHLFTEKFASPVARVFDVCRPWDASGEDNPDLLLLPQPMGTPLAQDKDLAFMATSRVFINQTEGGSWFAMSGSPYPLIVDAPPARVTTWDLQHSVDVFDQDPEGQALVGTHFIQGSGLHSQPAFLPAPPADDGYVPTTDPDNDAPVSVPEEDPSGIIMKVKSFPRKAAGNVIDLVQNPILLIIIVGLIISYKNDLRRRWNRMFAKWSWLVDSDVSSVDEQDELPEPISIVEAHVEVETNGEKKKAMVEESPERGEILLAEDSDKDAKEQAAAVGTTPEVVDANNLDGLNNSQEKEKKKAHRGRRGGVRHRKGKNKRELSQSRDDDPLPGSVEDTVNNVQSMVGKPSTAPEPDIQTVTHDMQAVTGSVIKMGNIEVDTEYLLGTGSNGTLVFAGKFDGRDIAVKRMLIQWYDIATQETKLLRESDDHPNGELLAF
jgi:serine/threonine-protein kinase/endoribonuclease IRE1